MFSQRIYCKKGFLTAAIAVKNYFVVVSYINKILFMISWVDTESKICFLSSVLETCKPLLHNFLFSNFFLLAVSQLKLISYSNNILFSTSISANHFSLQVKVTRLLRCSRNSIPWFEQNQYDICTKFKMTVAIYIDTNSHISKSFPLYSHQQFSFVIALVTLLVTTVDILSNFVFQQL